MARRRPLPDEIEERQESAPRDASDESIRDRAYYRYLERGGEDGRAEEDWLLAERELQSPREVEGDI